METEDVQQPSILTGTLWMIGLAALLFWLPVMGPLIAGYVGGRRIGNIAGAAIASIVAAVVATGLFLLVGAGLGFPLLSTLAEAGYLLILLIQAVPVIVAAIFGAATADSTANPTAADDQGA
jgi:hypothetical protein